MLKVSAVLCVCAAAWCSQALAAAAAVAAAGGRSDGGNFLDDKQWLTTISQYDKEVGQWNKFRDVSDCAPPAAAAARGAVGRLVGEWARRSRERAGALGEDAAAPGPGRMDAHSPGGQAGLQRGRPPPRAPLPVPIPVHPQGLQSAGSTVSTFCLMLLGPVINTPPDAYSRGSST